jgi:hypothetical protein
MNAGFGSARRRGIWVSAVVCIVAGAMALSPVDTVRSAEHAEKVGNPERSEIRCVGTYPLPGARLVDEIILYFDGAVRESVAEPFVMKPKVPGAYRYGDRFVAFKADKDISANFVAVSLHPDVKGANGEAVVSNSARFTFTTVDFRPVRMWKISEDEDDGLVLGVNFSALVSPATVEEYVRVSAGTEDLQFVIEQVKNTRNLRLRMPVPEAWPVTLHLAAGLPDSTGTVRTTGDSVFTYPERTHFGVKSVDWNLSDDSTMRIHLAFEAKVHAGDLNASLKIVDEARSEDLSYTLVTRGALRAHTVEVKHDVSQELKLAVHVAQGLEGIEHATLENPYTKRITSRNAPKVEQPSTLHIQRTSFYGWGKEGLYLNLRLSESVKQDELKAHLALSPEVKNLRVVRRYGYNYAVYGDWDSNQRYEMTLREGLPFGESGRLAKAVVRRIKSGEVPSYLSFGQTGKYYFPRRTGLALPIESRNLKTASVSLHRMFPSNIAAGLQDLASGEGSHELLRRWSQQIDTKALTLDHVKDRMVDTPFPFDEHFSDAKSGVFCLAINSEDGDYATKVVLFTNIGVIAHWEDDALALFAHDLYSLAPVQAGKVTVYSDKNQVMATREIGDDGVVHLRKLDTTLGVPSVVVVEQGEDYTFLELRARKDATANLPADMPYYDREGYDAFIYADRELYRPGATVHLRWIVRNNYGDALGGVPLMATVLRPNGSTLYSQVTMLSHFGTNGLDLETQDAYPTGKYTVQLTVPGDEKPLGAYTFSLEDFVPNRIKATATSSAEQWFSANEYAIDVRAEHLAGGVASDRKVEAKVVLKRGQFEPEGWKGFRFDNDSTYVPGVLDCGEGRTGKDGSASFKYRFEAPAQVSFPMKGIVLGKVYERGGRAVAGFQDISVFPSSICLGLAGRAAPGGGIELDVAAITPGATPADLASVKVTLERQIWSYSVRRYYSHHEPNWSHSYEPVESVDVAIADGRGALTFPLDSYGYYRVRVHSDATAQYSTLSFYSYGDSCQMVDDGRPSLIKLSLDKEQYLPGEEARLRIESPFDGRGIVAIQGETLEQIRVIEIANGVGHLTVPIKHGHHPNIWAEVTVVHAIKEGRRQVYPFSSSDMVNIAVASPRRHIQVAFENLPEEVRPHTKPSIAIRTTDIVGAPVAAEVTLAAVDEGIHSITGYASPDPLKHLSRSRRPDYRLGHYYDKVAYDFEKPTPGGDLEALLAKRSSSVDENWIKPLALWSGVVTTDEAGRATVELEIPEFSGQVRLVAVAVNPAATGAVSQNMYVRRPYRLQTSLPRFLLPDDTFSARVVAFNRTETACSMEVLWATDGALRQSSGQQIVSLDGQSEGTFTVALGAAASTGQGKLAWTGIVRDSAGSEIERIEMESLLPVRPPAAYASEHAFLTLAPGEQKAIQNTVFIDNALAEIELTASANPYLRLLEGLRYVVRYPYGCVEQTTSRLMPMYLLRKSGALSGQVLGDGEASADEDQVDYFIQSGIDRLFAMQTSSGGLGFWPGARNAYPYGSIYALHFLTLVKNDREYDVPEANLNALERYVRTIAVDWSSDTNSQRYRRAYAIFVLALGGDLEAIEQIDRFDDVAMPSSARYLLAAALAHNTQNDARISMYLANTPVEEFNVREQSGTLNSTIRNTAVELLAMHAMEIGSDETFARVQALTAYLQDQRHGSTQETAFIITALATYLSSIAENIDNAAGRIEMAGSSETVSGEQTFHRVLSGPGEGFTVTNTGATPLFLDVVTRGIPLQPKTEAEAEGLALMRLFDGKAEVPNFEQAGTYVVTLDIRCEEELENVVVADLLPAGLEIENPRLQADASATSKYKDGIEASHLEVRDDRLVVVFERLKPGRHKFHYIVRAVTPGSFQYPGAVAECMYAPYIRGTSQAETVVVSGGFEGV